MDIVILPRSYNSLLDESYKANLGKTQQGLMSRTRADIPLTINFAFMHNQLLQALNDLRDEIKQQCLLDKEMLERKHLKCQWLDLYISNIIDVDTYNTMTQQL